MDKAVTFCNFVDPAIHSQLHPKLADVGAYVYLMLHKNAVDYIEVVEVPASPEKDQQAKKTPPAKNTPAEKKNPPEKDLTIEQLEAILPTEEDFEAVDL